jgi:hypothetical protein
LVKKSSCCKYFSIKETDFFNSESSLSIWQIESWLTVCISNRIEFSSSSSFLIMNSLNADICLTMVKASMSHHVIDIEAISTLSGEVLTTQEKCSRHPDFIMDFFCNQHHLICCRNCMYMTVLPEYIMNISVDSNIITTA